jgi:hypothetical protein
VLPLNRATDPGGGMVRIGCQLATKRVELV